MKNKWKKIIGLGIVTLGMTLSTLAQTPGTLKWSFTSPGFAFTYGAAAIAANQDLYFNDFETLMFALHSDGSLKWQVSTPSGFINSDGAPALSSDGQTVYYSLAGKGLTARSVVDGSERWTYFTPTASTGSPPVSGPAVGPDGTIYFVGYDGNFYAVSRFGLLKWSVGFPFGVSFESSAAIGPDGTIYIGVFSGVYALNPDGTTKFVCTADGGAVSAPALAADGTIYLGGFGGLYAFNTDGTRRWKYTNTSIQRQFVNSGPTLAANGDIYFECFGFLYSVNTNGILNWQFSTEHTEQDSGHSSPAVAADGTVYVGSPSGKLYAVNSNGVSQWTYVTGGKVYVPSSIASDGTVYFGSLDSKFYAIYGSAPLANTPWPRFHHDLGNRGNADTNLVVPVKGQQLSGGDLHSAVVKRNGTLWTWGDNQFGELGNGTTTDSHSPVQALNVSNMLGVACGTGFTLGLKNDGTVWAWGHNANGELGDGTTTSHSSPQQVPGVSNIVSVAVNAEASFALRNDGKLYAWGNNGHGQMGDGTTTDRHSPALVSAITNAIAISAGENSVMALLSNGIVLAWGSNGNGQAGVGSTGNDKKTPVQVNTISNVVAIASGVNFSFALDSSGAFWCWGGNGQGQLGDGTTTTRTTPEFNLTLSGQNIVSFNAGEKHTLIVFANGTAVACGANGQGQLGDGTTADRHTPVAVSGINQGTTIAAGSKHSLIANDDLTLETWGDNSNGQLGDGTTTDRHTPVTVPSFSF